MKTEISTIPLFVWLRLGTVIVCGSLIGLGLSFFSSENSSHANGVSNPRLTSSTIHPINLSAEISAPMFRGTIQTIDRESLSITVHTDFGRVVVLAIGNCAVIEQLRVGDHVQLDVDAEGIVRGVEPTDTPPTAASPDSLRPPSFTGPCPESRT